MKLKKKVKYDKNTMTLKLGTDKKAVSTEDVYIIQALLAQDAGAAKLIGLVMETEHTDEIEAGFRMAAFVEEYSRFLENEPNEIIRYRNE
ncbi:MAG: hypothetical protein IKN55_06385 [Oscillospiraceae bacterium]|nr:hypothetical protein [Oscillospiraceae bacterium]